MLHLGICKSLPSNPKGCTEKHPLEMLLNKVVEFTEAFDVGIEFVLHMPQLV
jgi:hypothetical protein